MFPSTKGYCIRRPCDKLHICREFLEESCTLGKSCKKPHNIKHHLLIQHDLDRLSSCDLKMLFQKDLKGHKMKYAARILGPRGCSSYCKGRTCGEGDWCNFLHVCEKFISGSCKSEAECGLSHSFETRHAKRVLAFHKLGGLRSEEQILSVLRREMIQMKPQPCYEKPQASLDMKLFSHIIAHGEKCRLASTHVEKLLQEFSGDKVTYSCLFSIFVHLWLVDNQLHTSLPFRVRKSFFLVILHSFVFLSLRSSLVRSRLFFIPFVPSFVFRLVFPRYFARSFPRFLSV